MTWDDIDEMELIRWVNNAVLRNKILEVKDPKVSELVITAQGWSKANDMQKAQGVTEKAAKLAKS